jgi:hypothetical protein
LVERVDLLQNNIEEPVREKRRVGIGRLEGEGEAPAHRRRRIWPGFPADAADAGEQFEQPGGTISRRKERGGGGVLGILYSRS